LREHQQPKVENTSAVVEVVYDIFVDT
jgi:hypothetical protein